MEKKNRTAEEILKDLCNEIVAFNARRDEEWEFADNHGMDSDYWTESEEKEHEDILSDIQAGRDRIRGLLREATGDEGMDF